MSTEEKISWIPPKTDWYGYTDQSGIYHGDRFNVDDYERIRNNLLYLKLASAQYYKKFGYINMDEKTVRDYLYADDINNIEDNLATLTKKTVDLSFGEQPIYYANAPTFDYTELNRIESALKTLYERIVTDGRMTHQLSFTLGEPKIWQ